MGRTGNGGHVLALRLSGNAFILTDPPSLASATLSLMAILPSLLVGAGSSILSSTSFVHGKRFRS